ncbi:hypothetical protein Tco_0407949 [Tanacetum coccineum]
MSALRRSGNENMQACESNTFVLEDLTLLAGNPVKEILPKLNQLDHTYSRNDGVAASFQQSQSSLKISRLSRQRCQGRLLASFQDDAKYEHVGQDTRSQDEKDVNVIQGKD